MNTLPKIGGFWSKLNTALDSLRDGINLRTPRQGSGITINEGPSGYIISLANTPAVPIDVGSGGTGLTADQLALLKALSADPGINGTFTPTVPPTDHSHDTMPGPIEWLPWKTGATTGFRKITYLETVTVAGVASNMLKDVWTWAGEPFNARVCDADTWGG